MQVIHFLCSAATITNSGEYHFKYERYDTAGGALHDDHVLSVFVSSNEWLWVGSMSGLAVYDDKQWTNTTFRLAASTATRAVIRLLGGSTSCGPWHIVEGPPGTIWLGGYFGVSRFHGVQCEETFPEVKGMLAMAVNTNGILWVVNRDSVRTYNGRSWTRGAVPLHRQIRYIVNCRSSMAWLSKPTATYGLEARFMVN